MQGTTTQETRNIMAKNPYPEVESYMKMGEKECNSLRKRSGKSGAEKLKTEKIKVSPFDKNGLQLVRFQEEHTDDLDIGDTN